MRNKLVQFLIICMLVCVMVSGNSIPTYAKAIGITDEFDGLEGEGKYLGQDYRKNYQLDVEKMGMTDVAEKAFNTLANGIFNMICFVGLATVSVFYYAMDFDIAALLSPFIDTIQGTLRNNVFMPIFQLVLIGAFILAIVRFARRDFIGIMEQFGKVIFILVLSVLIVYDSSKFLSYATNITKSLAVSILTGVSGVDVSGESEEYAAGAAGVLWVSLVHDPWKSLEFEGYEYSEEDVEFFLSETDEEVRAKKIEEIKEDNKRAFEKSSSGRRIGQGIIIFLTMLIKCVVYIIVALLQLVFQLFAIIYVLLAPIILLLSLIPGYDFDLLGIWAKKILETQVGVLIITFSMGIMILIDNLLQQLSQTFGWFVILILQIVACTAMYLFRGQIFGALNTIQGSMRYPTRLKYKFMNTGNPYEYINNYKKYRDRKHALGNYNRNRNTGYKGQRGNQNNQSSSDTDVYDSIKKYKSYTETQVDKENQYPRQEEHKQQKERQYFQNTEQIDTGIKSCSYYAPREITDNLDMLWESAKARPRTTEKVNTNSRRPVINQGKTSVNCPATSGNAEAVKKRPVMSQQPESVDSQNQERVQVSRPATSGNAEAVKKRPVMSQQPESVDSQNQERVQVSRPATSGNAEAVKKRPVMSQQPESVDSQNQERVQVSRPATSGNAEAVKKRPVMSQQPESVDSQNQERVQVSRPATSGNAEAVKKRPVMSQQPESVDSQNQERVQVSRPATSGNAETVKKRPAMSQQPESVDSQNQERVQVSRPATSGNAETVKKRPAMGQQPESVDSQNQERVQVSRPATSGTAEAVKKRPVVSQGPERMLVGRPTTSKSVISVQKRILVDKPATLEHVDLNQANLHIKKRLTPIGRVKMVRSTIKVSKIRADELESEEND